MYSSLYLLHQIPITLAVCSNSCLLSWIQYISRKNASTVVNPRRLISAIYRNGDKYLYKQAVASETLTCTVSSSVNNSDIWP